MYIFERFINLNNINKSMKEESIFLDVVGDSPTMRVLQYLIEGRGLDYSLTDIAKNAGVSWVTLHKVFLKLIKYAMVVKTREIGKAKMYKINEKNQIAKYFIELYDMLIMQELSKVAKSQKIEVNA